MLIEDQPNPESEQDENPDQIEQPVVLVRGLPAAFDVMHPTGVKRC
jgi:hypothetical protein